MLQLHPYPVNWPMGVGQRFKGVYDRTTRQAHMFERTVRGAYKAPSPSRGSATPPSRKRSTRTHIITSSSRSNCWTPRPGFDAVDALKGARRPCFFGSAVNNFGVQLLLDALLKHAPSPAPRASTPGLIAPDRDSFSGFVFKIQGNMDPKHRDRVAFVRVVSGRFTRDLTVTHSRTGKACRLANAHKIFGRDREIIEEAYAGDVIGLVGYADFGIGDTLSEDPEVVFDEIPRFAPECFARISNPNPSKYKPFAKGIEQLLREGVVRAMTPRDTGDAKTMLLAAVGPLQFEVAQFRLQSEYGVDSRLELMEWTLARWIGPNTKPGAVDSAALPMRSARVRDEEGNEMILFPTPWSLQYLTEKHPEIELKRLPPAKVTKR